MNNVQGNLFRPLILPNGLSLENRFVLSPMVTNSSTSEGFVTDDDIAYAVRRAKSAPLQITGAAYVTEYGQLFEYGFSVSKDEDIPGLTKLAKAMKSKGAKAVLQLTHAGRFSSHTLARHGYVYGPSPMQLQSPYPHQVKELTHKDILMIIDEYVQATRRAIQAGFDGVEISSAQRLLIQTFFSTFSNQRKDEYGPQTLTNRCRLGLEVFKAVQKVIREEAESDFILGFRAMPEETRGSQIGYSIEEFMEFLEKILAIAQVDYLAIASWGHDVFRNTIRSEGVYKGQLVNQVIFEHFGDRVPIMATGGINSASKVFEALQHAHMVGASTPLVVDPEFLQKIKAKRSDQINLRIKVSDLEGLAIPKASFKDIVPLMDYGESLPKEAREVFRELRSNYREER